MKRQGRPSKAQTPAPKSERIKGSSVNKEGSAASKQSAKSIKLSSEVISVLEKKKDDYNEKHSSKVSLSTLKAVFRRGAGAYSSSHRPTISGGKPNSRTAWAFARVNKFLKKKAGESVKKAYVQDDDLMAEGGQLEESKSRIEALRDTAIERFVEAGFEVRKGSISRTDYGESAYFYVQYQGKASDNYGLGMKVRVSDHSVTSYNRMGSELLIYKEADIDKAILKAELLLRQDLFDKIEDINEEEIERVVITGKQYRNSIPENYYNPKTDVIIEDLGLSPKGNQKYLVKRMKKTIKVNYIRKNLAEGGQIEEFLAPNGEQSNLTPEQYKLVRTPKFKAWFGDWENDPENASKVIDKNGEPLVVFRGKVDNSIKKDKKNPYYIKGLWFAAPADSMEYDIGNAEYIAQHFSTDGEIESVFLNIRNPKKYEYYEDLLDEVERRGGADNFYESFKRYDGVLLEGSMTDGNVYRDDYIALRIDQVKLADGTNTTFDPNNPNIRFKQGGKLKDSNMSYKIKHSNGNDINFDDNYIDMQYAKGGTTNSIVSRVAENPNDFKILKSFDSKYIQNWEVKENGKVVLYKTNISQGTREYSDYPISDESKKHIRWVILLGEKLDPQNYILLSYDGYIRLTNPDLWEKIQNAKLIKPDGQLLLWNSLSKTERDNFLHEIFSNPENWENRGVIKDTTFFDTPFSKLKDVTNDFVKKVGKKYGIQNLVSLNELNIAYNILEEAKKMGYKKDDTKNPFAPLNEDQALYIKKATDKYFNINNNSDMQYAKGGKIEIGRLARGMSLSDIAHKHGLEVKDVSEEYKMGIETEMDHTTDPNVAKAIALDHLFEDPQYYTKLKKVEGLDNYLDDILITKDVFADGGEIPTEDLSVVFSFATPTGEKSRLTYLQQVLVRTKAFKSFFGDWETAAKNFIKDNKENFGLHFKNVSKILYHDTLEPRVVFHGTRADQEFFTFNVGQGQESNIRSTSGRPYGYFAHNIEYSMNFTTLSRGKLPFLYSCFLNIRNPFVAVGRDYYAKSRNAKYWLQMISGTLVWDKLGKIERDEETKKIEKVVESQIGDFVRRVIGDQMRPFWYLMSTDMEKIFKHFMISHGYDGIMFAEELTTDYDIQKPDQFTEAEVIFDSNQVKLADGRNLDFNPMNDDIRYKKGGKIKESEIIESTENNEPMTRKERIGMIISPKKYAQGGSVLTEHGKTDDAKKGGYFQGRSHAEGGIKVKNVDTGQYLEVEGEEVIITKGAVNDPKKREFEGQMLTNKEILSKINQSGGGVSFEKGGEIKGDHCGCSGKKYKYGGKILEDFEIIRIMNNTYKPFEQMAENSRKFVDSLINKMKK